MSNEQRDMTEAEMARGDAAPTDNMSVNWPANKVQEGLRRLIAEGKIDEDGRELIFWLYSWMRDNNLGWTGAAAKTGISSTVLYHLVHCDYAAKYDSMLEKVAKFKRMEEERGKSLSLGFVKTGVADKIFRVCDAALYDGMPAFVYGSSQTGKTTALEEYQRTHNHGTTKYIRMGVRWSKRRLVREIARACKCFCDSAHSCDLEERICATLTDRMLLIIDEFHLALETTTDLAAKEVVEFVREIYDRTHCGLVICGTKVAETGLEEGKFRLLFDQLRRRGLVKLVLPDAPPRADVNAFAKQFGLGAPTGETWAVVKGLLKRYGLGMYVKYLQKSYALAAGQKRPLTWDDFAAVCNGYAALAVAHSDY